jgi:hypothetical protein
LGSLRQTGRSQRCDSHDDGSRLHDSSASLKTPGGKLGRETHRHSGPFFRRHQDLEAGIGIECE